MKHEASNVFCTGLYIDLKRSSFKLKDCLSNLSNIISHWSRSDMHTVCLPALCHNTY